MIILTSPALGTDDEATSYVISVLKDGTTRDLWFRTPSRFGHLFSDRAEASLLGLLMPAMAAGSDIRVNGRLSAELLENVQGPIQAALCRLFPELHPIKIHAPDIVDPVEPADGTATGFTLGVDSFVTVRDNYLELQAGEQRITHLTYLNVGSHYRGGDALFRSRLGKASEVAARLKLPIIPIDSNLDSFYPPSLDYRRSLTLRHAAAAYLLQNGIGRYLFASGVHRSNQRQELVPGIQHADNYLLPLLSSAALTTEPSGSAYRRIDKVKRVANIVESYDSLHVCTHVFDDGTVNCLKCQKCLRTALTLEIFGLLDRYSAVFDVRRYRRARSRWIAQMYYQDNGPNREVIELIEESDFPIPFAAKLMMALRVMAVRRFFQKVRRRLGHSFRDGGAS